jgi:hypothetical protein
MQTGTTLHRLKLSNDERNDILLMWDELKGKLPTSIELTFNLSNCVSKTDSVSIYDSELMVYLGVFDSVNHNIKKEVGLLLKNLDVKKQPSKLVNA